MDDQETVTFDDPLDQPLDLSGAVRPLSERFAFTTLRPKPRNTGAPTSSLWDSVWGVASKTAGSVARGVLEGMNEASNTVAGAALAISKGTGAYKLGRTPEERAEWLKNYEKPTENQNPFQWAEEFVEGIAGPKQSGLYGVVSGISQFAVGMVGATKALKALGVAAPTTTGARIGFEAAKGGLVDATFFKANADRLSDAVKGTFLENPISNLLESDEDDTELEGRIKNVAEGMLLGTTIDLMVAGTKAMRAARKGDMAEASRLLDEATVAAETPKPTDVVTVREVEDGVEVVPVNVVADAAPTAAKYATREEAETVAAGMNYVNKTVNHGVSVDEWAGAVEVSRWAEAKRAYDEGLDPRDAAQILDNTGLNIKYDTSPDEVINVVKALADTHLEPLEIARGRPEAWAETAEKAKALAVDLGIDEDPTRAVAQAAAVFGDTDNLAARLYMLRTVRAKLADDVAKVSRAADLNPEDGDLMLALEQGLNRLNALHVYLSGSVSNTARALRQQAMTVGEGAAKEADAGAGRPLGATQEAGGTSSILEGLSNQEIRDLARSVFMTDGDPAKMMRVLLGLEQTKKAKVAVPETQYQRVRDFALTWRMEAMLSSPTTHVGNIVSNAMVMMQRPVEYWWAGVRSKDSSLRDFAVDMVEPMALWHDVQDSMAAMSKAFKTGLNVLDPQAPDRVGGLLDMTDAAKAQREADGTRHPFKEAMRVIGRLPSRALMSADEFFKQMNYRMNVRAQILRKARESGITDVAELQQRLKDQSKWNFAPDGAAANPWALDYARVSTFTNDLGAGTLGQDIQSLVNNNPLIGRMIMPFVKTPINIFRFAAERTPIINKATAEWKAAMKSGDPERIALAKSKAEVGALFWTAGTLLAMNKVITGGGPSDPGLRRQLQQAGWQPYSIRIGDRYVSYRKADPVLTAFSIVADAVEMSGELDDSNLGDVATVAMASVAASVTSKSFMQGVSDFFDMISSGREDKAQAFLENTAGSFLPNILRKVDPNPFIMESKGVIEELKARTPGFSQTLEPRRNLFGEKILRPPGYLGVDNIINPFTVGDEIERPNVMNELVKLGKAMPMPEPVLRQGSNSIDLRDRETFDDRRLPNGQTQSPYDRWLELVGETKLRTKLTAMVTDPDYQSRSEEDKLSFATALVKGAQEEAKARMIAEYPQVQQALQMSDEMQGAIREVDASTALQGVYDRYSKQFVKRKARPNAAIPE
jgi:hypothetical protein